MFDPRQTSICENKNHAATNRCVGEQILRRQKKKEDHSYLKSLNAAGERDSFENSN